MIIEVPTAEELREAGLGLLNLAWSTTLGLYRESGDEVLAVFNLTGDYWQHAQFQLSNALVVIEQAVETLVKARIASVSPYLILSDGAAAWRNKTRAISDTPFSQLRTVGGEQLLTAHNCIVGERLDRGFEVFFDDLRRSRNIIMHQPNASGPVTPSAPFIGVTRAFALLCPDLRWMDVRLNYLKRHPLTAPHDGALYAKLHSETDFLIQQLSPSALMQCFKFDAARLRYACPKCDGQFAQLASNDPRETSLACIICGCRDYVERERCDQPGCDCDVLYNKYCLRCERLTLEEQERQADRDPEENRKR